MIGLDIFSKLQDQVVLSMLAFRNGKKEKRNKAERFGWYIQKMGVALGETEAFYCYWW